ncbi:hypothetical protein [Microvirga sp. 2TAF3]|uniref:hypothetical protein n=1 Tax=Microvirga sp. 2TAF3 TaxID=3233014 RepID=UPI003F958CC6
MSKATYADLDEDDMLDLLDERPVARARKPLPWLRMFLLSGFSIAALVYFARQDERPMPLSGGPKPVPASVLIAPPPIWTPIVPANALYGIEKGFAPVTLEARQHSAGGREDTLVLGAFGDIRHGRISLVQGITETGKRSFFVDIVRRAADAGLSITRNAQSRMVMTKFGPVEAAAMTLAGRSEQNCQAFRFADPETSFGFQGWLCGADVQPVDENHLACFIDRVTLAGGDNAVLRTLFARAERSRTDACALAARTASISVKSPSRP